MYYVLFFKNDNLTPDEAAIAKRGGVWLHTGISGETRQSCINQVAAAKKNGLGFFGDGYRTRIWSEEECQRA